MLFYCIDRKSALFLHRISGLIRPNDLEHCRVTDDKFLIEQIVLACFWGEGTILSVLVLNHQSTSNLRRLEAQFRNQSASKVAVIKKSRTNVALSDPCKIRVVGRWIVWVNFHARPRTHSLIWRGAAEWSHSWEVRWEVNIRPSNSHEATLINGHLYTFVVG